MQQLMIWLGLAIAIATTSVLGARFVARRARRAPGDPAVVAPDLAARVGDAVQAFTAASPWSPAMRSDAPAVAAAVESALIAGDARRALAIAETAVAAAPDDRTTRVWLAWALCANAQPGAALDQLAVAAADRDALALYLAARAEHLRFEHVAGATGTMPPLVTTADLAIVTLARGRGAPAWLQGTREAQLSAAEVRAAIAEHRVVTARCLARALDALALAPGFADAAYLVARLSIKAGLVDSGRAMFDAVAPAMTGRPDADAFARDRADLADPHGAVAAAKRPPVADTGKRSRSLRVLA